MTRYKSIHYPLRNNPTCQLNHLCKAKAFFLLFFAFFTEGGKILAQQESAQTLFMFNTLAINPGVAGSRDIPTLTLTARKQWMGFKGAPIEQNLSFHTPLLSKRLGFGLTFGNRNISIFEAQTASLALSYSPIRTKDFALRIGLQGSARRLGFKFEDATQATIITNERTSASNLLQPRVFGNFGMGIFMNYKDCFMGFSVPFYYSNIIGINTNTKQTATEQPHYHFMMGYTLPLLDNFYWKPSTIIKKTANAPWGLDINNSVIFNDKITLGGSYRLGQENASDIGESMAFLMFFQVNDKWGLGGAYDFPLSTLKKYTDGSFEVVARFDLQKSSLRFSNPRVF
jgi:type IX secretion system PorP/SprF family membrane protein